MMTTILSRYQAEVVKNYHNPNIRNIGQGEAQKKMEDKTGLNLSAVKSTAHCSSY
jgi:hypothetical protein